jgi:hypothetical protein
MFRFTIRELLLLTGIIAMGAGWWVDRRNAADDRAFRDSLVEIKGDVYVDSIGELNGVPGTVYVKPPSPHRRLKQ